ncbi:MAG TPA: DUF6232 family protein [Cytophagales bacterium]|nr:DUF6232 family protein [Cytophagales bacterium]
MEPNKVIYTDGHGVTVTDENLRVKEKVYSLRGIIHHGLWTIHASKFPAILLIFIGLIALILGILEFVAPFFPDMMMNGNSISPNMVAIWAGAILMTIGILWLILSRDKYAVRISTAEGDKNAIVSSKKEYINQIVTAINDAFRSKRDISIE